MYIYILLKFGYGCVKGYYFIDGFCRIGEMKFIFYVLFFLLNFKLCLRFRVF